MRSRSRVAWGAWQRFAVSRAGAGVMFGWAFAEAIAWPIIPEFLLVPLAAGARRRVLGPFCSTIVGSALGGTLLYLCAMRQPDRARLWLSKLPGVTDRQTTRASGLIRAHGVGALAMQPWTFVPLKVWAIVAAAEGIDPRLAVPTFAISRALRMAVFAWVAGLLGDRLGAYLREYSLFAGLAYAAVFFYGERNLMR